MKPSDPLEPTINPNQHVESKAPAVDKTENEKFENYETISDLVELIEGIGSDEILKITSSSKEIMTINSASEADKKRRFTAFSDAIAKEITTRALNMITRQNVLNVEEMSLVGRLATEGGGSNTEGAMEIIRGKVIESLGLERHVKTSEESLHEDRHGTPIVRLSEIVYYDFPKIIDEGSMELSELVKMVLESYGLTRDTQKICESIISGKIRAQLAK